MRSELFRQVSVNVLVFDYGVWLGEAEEVSPPSVAVAVGVAVGVASVVDEEGDSEVDEGAGAEVLLEERLGIGLSVVPPSAFSRTLLIKSSSSF
ncbi:conserved hypothetical protein [Arthrobacter sp. 9V]|nr:conserved hypothetical protein [Arthrobacter sp. 9V]